MYEPPPKPIKHIYYIYIIYVLYYIYIIYVFNMIRGVWEGPVRQKGGRPLAFLAVFDDFRLPMTPRTTPMPWINSFYFIGLSSSRWTTFLLVWYMSEVILGVISQLRKNEPIWNLEIPSVGTLLTIFPNFKSARFCEVEIWPLKWPQTCTKPI